MKKNLYLCYLYLFFHSHIGMKLHLYENITNNFRMSLMKSDTNCDFWEKGLRKRISTNERSMNKILPGQMFLNEISIMRMM